MADTSLTRQDGWKAYIPPNAADLVDPEGLNRIPVYIPDLQPAHEQAPQNQYIWVYPDVGANLYCTSDGKCSGSFEPPAYTPTKESPIGTPVTVKFRNQSTSSGYISSKNTAAVKESCPKGQSPASGGSGGGSNSTYDTFRTRIISANPDGSNISIIDQKSTGAFAASAGSININFENGKSFIVINSGGIQIQSSGALNLTVSGNVNLNCSGTVNVQASGPINLDGASIKLNSGSGSNNGSKGTPVPQVGG